MEERLQFLLDLQKKAEESYRTAFKAADSFKMTYWSGYMAAISAVTTHEAPPPPIKDKEYRGEKAY